MNEQGRQFAHDGCDPLSAGPAKPAATHQRLPPPAFLKILSFEEAAYLLGCAPSVVCRLVMETCELAAVRFTTSGERLGTFSPHDIHGVMDRVGEDGSITATVPASGKLIDPGWRDIKAGVLRIDRAELDRFITMSAPTVAVATAVPKGLPKRAMVKRHAARWTTIETDMTDASTNGLAVAAKAGSRGWFEVEALAWAEANGRLLSAPEPGTIDAVMGAGFTSRRHTLVG